MIVVLLALALVCLVVGLVLTNSAWLLASLAATAIAAVALWAIRARALRRPGPANHSAQVAGTPIAGTPIAGTPIGPAITTALDFAEAPDVVWVVGGRARYHRAGCAILEELPAHPLPVGQAAADGFIVCSLCQPSTR